MKRILCAISIFLFAISMVGCSTTTTTEAPTGSGLVVLEFPHLDGHGHEMLRSMPILFEYEMRDYVKYQIAFVACTCRSPRDNYWSVAYVDISKTTGELLYISFDVDSSGHYQAGVWGDSNPIPETGITYENHFKIDFIPWLVGQNADDLDGINIFYDVTPSVYANFANTKQINEPQMIDAYAGSSVSTNNMIRVMKTLLEYHLNKYINK